MTSEVLQNPYFVRLYIKHIFNYTIVKNRSSFIYFFEGGGGGVRKDNGGKKM